MDTITGALLVVGILALLVIVGFIRFRQKSNVSFKAPFGTEVTFEGDRNESPGISGEKIVSDEGNISAQDETGKGIRMKDVKAKMDVVLTNKKPN